MRHHLYVKGIEQPADYVTGQGHPIFFDRPELAVIDDIDVVTQMQNTNRFNGAYPWDLLSHSILVHDIILSLDPSDYASANRGLIHDCHEVMVGDLPTGLKKHLPDFQKMEHLWEMRFAEHYGFGRTELPEKVKRADTLALLLEMEYFEHPPFEEVLELMPERIRELYLHSGIRDANLINDIRQLTKLEKETIFLQSVGKHAGRTTHSYHERTNVHWDR